MAKARRQQQQKQQHPATADAGPYAEPGPTHRAPQHYGGMPVAMHTRECTFLHTRALQGSQRTHFLRAVNPGMGGVPPFETNYPVFLTELDVRLHNMHRTLEAVHQRSQSVVEAATTAPEEASHQGCSTSSEHEPTTAELRNAVNTNLVTQLDFFAGCVARWAADSRLPHERCKCMACNCVCARTDAALRGRAYEAGSCPV